MIALFAPMRTESGRIRISHADRHRAPSPFCKESSHDQESHAGGVDAGVLPSRPSAIAQGQDQDNDNTTTGASGSNSDTVVVNDLIDLFV